MKIISFIAILLLRSPLSSAEQSCFPELDDGKVNYVLNCREESCALKWKKIHGCGTATFKDKHWASEKTSELGRSDRYRYLQVITGSDTSTIIALPLLDSKPEILTMILGADLKNDLFLVQTGGTWQHKSRPTGVSLTQVGIKDISISLGDLKCESAFFHYCISNFSYKQGVAYFDWHKPFSENKIKTIKVLLQ